MSDSPRTPTSLFLSYAHSDAAFVAGPLVTDLKSKGFDVWLDTERLNPGASWTQGIESGIDKADVMLAFISKGSFNSDICRAEQLRALRKNKRVIPILLEKDADVPVHLEATQFLRFHEWTYENGVKLLQAIIEDAAITAVLPGKYRKRYKTYPPLPQHFIARPALLNNLRQEIIKEGDTTGITAIAIRGMGGIGKTVLAQAVCHDEAVQDAFPDGVLWVNIGRDPSDEHLCEQIREVAKALGDTLDAYDTLQGCQNQLRNTLSDKSVLIVLDDVWDPTYVELFNAEAPRCCLLITTRSQAVTSGTSAREVSAQVMSDIESRALLARRAGLSTEKLPPEASAIIPRCGGLPLALTMLGARARKGRSEWARILDALDKGKSERVSMQLSDYRYATLFETTRVSIDLLKEEQKCRYLDLAVFPPNTPIPEKILGMLWQVSEDEVADTVESWIDASLAQSERGLITLHDLQLDFVRAQSPDVMELHRRLLDAYRKQTSGRWADGKDDGYYFKHLAYHLFGAGCISELRSLLLNPDWIRAKLKHLGVTALMSDYEWAPPDPNLLLIHQALQLSAHVLARDPAQMASQFLGRLRSLPSDEIQKFLSKIRTSERLSWLEPLSSSLWKPGAILISTLAGHAGAIKAVSLKPDGKRALSASDDHTLKLWDLENGQELQTFRGHSAPVNVVVMTPDGKLAVSSSYDRTMKVWDLIEGKEILTLSHHSHLVNAVAITLDGKRMVSAAYDRTLKVWSLPTGTELYTLIGHSGWVTAMTITRDGKRVISASHDRMIKIWNMETGSLIHNLEGHLGSIDQVILTPDEKQIISASHDNTIRVWDLDSGTPIRVLTGHNGWVHRVAITGDGLRIVSAAQDSTIRVWELNSGMQIRVLVGHAGWVSAVLLMSDGRRAISVSDDRNLKIWDLESGIELHTLAAHSGPVNALVATPDGRSVVSVNGSEDATLRVWDFESVFDADRGEGHAQMVNAITISNDGEQVVSASSDRTLKVRQLKTDIQMHDLIGHGNAVNAVAMFAKGTRAVSASSDKTLKIWDLIEGSCLHTLTGHSRSVEHVAITPDGKCAVSSACDGTLKVWDLMSGTELCTLKGHSGWVRHFVITPDGNRVVSASYDHTVRIWDLHSGNTLRVLNGHESWVNAVIVSQEEDLIVSASYDNTLRTWNLENGACRHTLFGHSGPVSAVAVMPDRQRAISASHDHTLRIWSLVTGSSLCILTGHTRSVNAVVVAGSGTRIVSASRDNTVKMWTTEGKNVATFSAHGPIICLAAHPDGETVVAGDYVGRIHVLRLHEECESH